MSDSSLPCPAREPPSCSPASQSTSPAAPCPACARPSQEPSVGTPARSLPWFPTPLGVRPRHPVTAARPGFCLRCVCLLPRPAAAWPLLALRTQASLLSPVAPLPARCFLFMGAEVSPCRGAAARAHPVQKWVLIPPSAPGCRAVWFTHCPAAGPGRAWWGPSCGHACGFSARPGDLQRSLLRLGRGSLVRGRAWGQALAGGRA